MKVTEQGARRDRHHVIPRTLTFVTRSGPQSGAPEVLLLKGAPTKRLWANRYNGLGGHVERDEDIYAAAQRELAEETGLTSVALTLRGVVHIDTGRDDAGAARPGVLVFVFAGVLDVAAPDAPLPVTTEGTPEWVSLATLDGLPLVDDLPMLLARALGNGPLFYALYTPAPDGTLHMQFRGEG